METYIDFIKKYNNEKSISSSDSEFDNFLKGGDRKQYKGGFPPIYSVESVNSESFREFSPNLKIVDVLKKNPKTPFLNVNEGGFLNLFKSKEKKKDISKEIKDEDISSIVLPKELEVVSVKSEKNQEKSNFDDTSIDLPNELEVITINSVEDNNQFVDKIDEYKNKFVDEVDEYNNEFVDQTLDHKNEFIDKDDEYNEFVDQLKEDQVELVDLDTSLDLPEDIDIISINGDEGGDDEDNDGPSGLGDDDKDPESPDDDEDPESPGDEVSQDPESDEGPGYDDDGSVGHDVKDHSKLDQGNQDKGGNENTNKLLDMINTSEDNVNQLPANDQILEATSENNLSQLDEYSDTSNNFMSQLGGNNFDPSNNLNSEQIEEYTSEDSYLDTSVDLPENIEVLTIENENKLGDDIDNDTSVDLPDLLEVVSIDKSNEISNNNLYQSGGEELDSIDLPNSLEIISIQDTEDEDQNEGYIESYDDTSIDLPQNLEVVSLNQDGGFLSESSKDLFDSSIYLPNHVEVITLNRDEILESVDTDSSILDILDIKSKDTKSIGNLFMKNFK